ncbi:MAG: virulence-associated E [Nostoc sp. TH1S01]|nr:virulence-associated E [Nostoc sp. TH1S01]
MKTINPILAQSSEYLQAKAYISLISGREDAEVTFQTFGDSSRDENLTRCWHDTLENSWNRLQRLNEQGAGVFVTVNETDGSGNREAVNITKVRALFVDCDESIPESWHLQPSLIVSTSANKCHAFWLLAEPVEANAELFRGWQERLIDHYGSDKVVKDLPRVMRLPGFLHQKDKDNPSLVTIIEASGTRYTVADIMDGLPELTEAKPKPKPTTKPQYTLDFLGEQPTNGNFRETLERFANKLKQAKEGERNSTLNTIKYTLAGAYPNELEAIDDCLFTVATDCLGLSESETRATLASANAGANKPITLNLGNGGKRSKSNIMRETLEAFFGDELQWDEMQNKLRFRNVHMSIEKLHDVCERELDLDLPFESFRRVASVIAQDNPYHAVRSYLQSLTAAADPEPILSALYQAMGVNNRLHRLYIRRWLVSAVARAMSPGCKADCALVLQGKQGIGKTTFFSSLFGEFFQTLGEHKSDVDQLLAMTRSWCIEWGEIENAFSRKAVAAIKSFMTIERDTYRRPYASEPDTYPRHFVICGTTNQSEFLTDNTGNRRFWVVNLEQRVDTREIAKMRDEVWSAALALFLAGERWHLEGDEVEKSAEDTAQYEQEHPWVERILAYTAGHNPCTLADIMEKALKIDTSRLNDKKAQSDVTAILRKLGYTKRQERINGVKGRYWFRPTLDNTNADDVQVTKENIPPEEYIDVY